jgi:hypothetical protein
MALTREDLLQERFGIETFELAGVGQVKIRSVSRALVMGMRGQDLPALDQERMIVSAAMVEPKMTEADVAAWQDASPAGELEPLTAAIMRLSGLTKDAPKEAVKGFRS